MQQCYMQKKKKNVKTIPCTSLGFSVTPALSWHLQSASGDVTSYSVLTIGQWQTTTTSRVCKQPCTLPPLACRIAHLFHYMQAVGTKNRRVDCSFSVKVLQHRASPYGSLVLVQSLAAHFAGWRAGTEATEIIGGGVSRYIGRELAKEETRPVVWHTAWTMSWTITAPFWKILAAMCSLQSHAEVQHHN